ncbi:putative DNA-binding domain-containing protein [Caballeronia sp.]|uniref:HvfC/BufC family peptide modification chaperone n=1 Tax=Caballeronia sp. TaxID=1931223 RepID=UPI003C67AE48
MATQLESLQRMFAAALGDAQYEPPLLSRLKPVPPISSSDPGRVDRGEAADTRALAAADDALRRRIALYRGNVRGQWRAALANAYPVLLALGGDAYFDALSLAYARAHPSESGDLIGFGDALPSFIEQYEQDSRFRYFGDMARLEWSLHVASFAADVEAFTPQHWIEIGQERLLQARLVVNEACVAIASQHAITDIWLAHQPGGVFPQDVDVPSWTLVVRPLWRPTTLVHSAAAHAAFVALQRGNTLNEALDAAFALDPEFDFASQWHAWISTSAITGTVSVHERSNTRA